MAPAELTHRDHTPRTASPNRPFDLFTRRNARPTGVHHLRRPPAPNLQCERVPGSEPTGSISVPSRIEGELSGA